MSTYAMSMFADKDEVDQIAQLKEIHDYQGIRPQRDSLRQRTFSHLCLQSVYFVGMKRFGGGEGYDKGIEKWKYFAFHFFMMTIWGLGMYVTLYCCGIGVLASALISGSAFPPFMIVTMLAETKIFKSRFLAAALLRGGEKVESLKKKECSTLAGFLVMQVMQIILMFLLPFIFLVRPYTQLVPEDKYLEYILLAVLNSV